jgi:hypothetical protein
VPDSERGDGIDWGVLDPAVSPRLVVTNLIDEEGIQNHWLEWWVLCLLPCGSKRLGTPSKYLRAGKDIGVYGLTRPTTSVLTVGGDLRKTFH